MSKPMRARAAFLAILFGGNVAILLAGRFVDQIGPVPPTTGNLAALCLAVLIPVCAWVLALNWAIRRLPPGHH